MDWQKIKNLSTWITPVPWINAPIRLMPPKPIVKKPELDQEEILDRVMSMIPDEFQNDPWLCRDLWNTFDE